MSSYAGRRRGPPRGAARGRRRACSFAAGGFQELARQFDLTSDDVEDAARPRPRTRDAASPPILVEATSHGDHAADDELAEPDRRCCRGGPRVFVESQPTIGLPAPKLLGTVAFD